jgi:hypothetical protein
MKLIRFISFANYYLNNSSGHEFCSSLPKGKIQIADDLLGLLRGPVV